MSRPATAIIKMKPQGKPPVRPPGVGYDSEADEAEDDPAIESQFVLRMQPGPDCDLLRAAIDNKTIGKTTSHGGPGVQFRFFDKEGRKAMVTIQGRMYAASMVELPCVIETLKSWNKRDWVKSADVCQMLLVLGPVQSEEEAKKYPRPREIEPDSHRYPHGLTPPMQWVRRRRFRPRKSYLDVERITVQIYHYQTCPAHRPTVATTLEHNTTRRGYIVAVFHHNCRVTTSMCELRFTAQSTCDGVWCWAGFVNRGGVMAAMGGFPD